MKPSIRTLRHYLGHFCTSGLAFFGLLTYPAALFAQNTEEASGVPQTAWVLPYFAILLFLGLGILILLRSAKRTDSCYTLEEQAAIRAEEMKKATKSHV